MKRPAAVLAAFAALVLAAPASALNPQPLPPKVLKYGLYNKHNKVMLNPQPLPPGPCAKCGVRFGRGKYNGVLLNPQPLPPRSKYAYLYRR